MSNPSQPNNIAKCIWKTDEFDKPDKNKLRLIQKLQQMMIQEFLILEKENDEKPKEQIFTNLNIFKIRLMIFKRISGIFSLYAKSHYEKLYLITTLKLSHRIQH